MHDSSDVCANNPLYFPPAHIMHGDDPLTYLYVPVIHSVHATPSGPVYPTLQVQFKTFVLAAGPFVLAGHGLHSDSICTPRCPLYFPAVHAKHALAKVCAVPGWYVPAGQSTHCPPASSLYFPVGHSLQGPPEGPEYPCAFVCGDFRVHLPACERVCWVICVYMSQTDRDTQNMETRRARVSYYLVAFAVCQVSSSSIRRRQVGARLTNTRSSRLEFSRNTRSARMSSTPLIPRDARASGYIRRCFWGC